MENSKDSSRKRVGRYWLWILVSVVVLIATTCLWYVARSPLAKLRATGVPVSYEDLANRSTPTGDNAATLLQELHPRLQAMPSTVGELSQLAAGGPLTTEQRTVPERLLKENSDILRTLDLVAESSTFAPSLTLEQLENEQERLDDIHSRRSAARLITLRTRLALANDDPQEACDSAVSLLRLAKHLEEYPFLVNRLVACAVQQMALEDAHAVMVAGLANEQSKEQLRDACTAIEDRSGYREMLITERVLSIEKLNDFPLPMRLTQRSGVLEVYEQAIADAPTVGTGVPGRTPVGPKAAGPLTSQLVPGLESAREVENRITALASCLLIRLALSGKDAETPIDGASLDLPSSTLVDPFTGKQLVIEYRPTTDDRDSGWWVYSVGSNQIDDGGKFDDMSDVGYAPPKRR